MALGRLDIRSVRNLADTSLRDLQATNIFYGENGGGKTSVLESIFLLGMARSFRSAQIKPVITHGHAECVVYGELEKPGGIRLSLGLRRDRKGGFQIKVGGQRVNSAAQLAEQAPMQVINADSFNLLAGGPLDRRRYLDWGVFHVEHQYQGVWQRFQRCIKQRNSLLRHGKIQPAELEPWNREFSEAGEHIDTMRKAYFVRLSHDFSVLLERLSPGLRATELRYRRGWDGKTRLSDALLASEKTDREQGFTHVGPQRADIKVLFDGHDAGVTLSRGQQKLVVCALKLAQGQLLSAEKERLCIYLVDDLPSELDDSHCRRVCDLLGELQAQVFLTCVNSDDISKHWQVAAAAANEPAMFHVEHGRINRVDDHLQREQV